MNSLSRELFLPTHIPIASMRRVYKPEDVERRLHKLPNKDHEGPRATYERMLEKGPERFQVKPSGIPAMEHLYEELPNFAAVLDHVRRSVALVHDTSDPLQIPPILLLGPPGVGKTHFASEVAKLLGTGKGFVSMSSLTAGWILSGASSQWKGARPGKVFEAIVDGKYANPIMVVDEIDKARPDGAYDPLGALYSLLEPDTAEDFIDEFAEVPIDTSQVIWVATANDERGIPEPILNRMEVYEVHEPTKEQARIIAQKIYREIRGSHDWGKRFDPELSEEVLEHLSTIVPREMRRLIQSAFGNAALRKSEKLERIDFRETGTRRMPAGFVH